MATCVVMPKAGVSVETCIMGEWVKKPGDKIAKNDVVFTYETDKSVFEYRAEEDGVLLHVLVSEGDDVPVMEPVCYIGKEGEDISALLSPAAREAVSEEAVPEAQALDIGAVPLQEVSAAPDPGRIRISPRARAAAGRMDIRDWSGIAGSGPNGRIIERDVRAYAQTGAAAEDRAADVSAEGGADLACPERAEKDYTDRALSGIRRAIARNMHASLSGMAQLTHSVSFDATEMIRCREKLKASSELLGLPKVSLNDMLLFAVSRILPRYPDLNAHFLDDRIRCFAHVHLGMAVDTPRGLMVPTIFDADRKSLAQISREAKSLAQECQSGAVDPGKLAGASFTVTNLGMFGVESFTPVINPPQTGILGVCSVVDRVRNLDGGVGVYPAMGLSLTYDHRALDGAPASRFLQELCRGLENFSAMLAV